MKLTLEGIGKRFGDLTVLDGIDLSVGEGEVLALLGWSGSGKTTLLRVLAGFETPDRGRVTVDGEEVTHQPPARRGFGMVFQHYALFPHLTVGENVAFGLESRGAKGPGVADRVAHVLSLVDLAGFAERKVGEISGGQQQRVALARALAPEPRILLLDEPLSNLDPTLRERTRRELKALIREVGITTVLVTHEQEEAFDLGDRVAVLHQGRLHQVGIPEELYQEPATRFVATFVGRSAILPGTYAQGGVRLDLPGKPVWPGYPVPEDGQLGPRVHLIVRPEALALSRKPSPSSLAGKVVDRRYAGVVTYCTIALDEGPEVEVLTSTHAAEIGEAVHVRLRPDSPEPRIYHRD